MARRRRAGGQAAGWRAAYDEWLAYFDRLGIRSVGMGWILVYARTASGRTCGSESWPHPVAQPVGDVFARHAAAVDAFQLPTADPPGRPPAPRRRGAGDHRGPARRTPSTSSSASAWLLRAVKADTALAATLGAVDGDLTVGQVLSAVAQVR